MKRTTHAVAVLIGLATALYQYPGVQAAVNAFLAAHPALAAMATAAGALMALYHNPATPSAK
jgi:hypothetical protein